MVTRLFEISKYLRQILLNENRRQLKGRERGERAHPRELQTEKLQQEKDLRLSKLKQEKEI